MRYLVVFVVAFCVVFVFGLIGIRGKAKAARPNPYEVKVKKKKPSISAQQEETDTKEANSCHQTYQQCLNLYSRLKEFPDYSVFRKEGPPAELAKYAALCRELSGMLQAATQTPRLCNAYPKLHLDMPFGSSSLSTISSEEYMSDRIRFYSSRAGYADEASRQMIEFTQVLESIPAVDISISDVPAPEVPVDEITYSTITKKTPRDKLGNFVVIDTETTGLSIRSSIVEIAAIRFRGFQPTEKFTTLCSPKGKISEQASAINGITEEMVARKPQFIYIAAALQEFIGKDNLVGHNLPFDMKFITKYGVDTTQVKRKYYDTLDIAKHTLKREREGSEAYFDVYDYKLATLCDFYHIPFYGAHRALADCYATGKLLECLAKDRE